MFGLISRGFKVLREIEENKYLQKYSSQQERAKTIGFLLIIQCLYVFSYNVIKIKNHYNKNPDIFAYIYLA